jgi:esterase/lipase superfamily enzyme
MPTPEGINPEGILFDLSKENEDENLLATFYATNRNPFDATNRESKYTIFPSDNLRLGFVVHRIGEKRMSWDEVLELSLQKKRKKDLLLKQEYSREMAVYHLTADLNTTTPQANGFFDDINQLLERSFDKDILIYAHGANSNFYRATAQGAQFFHFTGHNSVVLSFSWPSAENLLKYKTDVAHAKKTVPAFARLVDLLATHTNAKHINILAYSAGAQVVAPGLAMFEDIYPDLPKEDLKKKLRIGEVYFASPDTAFKPFAQRYMKFKDIVERTTVNINENDSVLRLSAFQNGMSRLGKPDMSEVTEEELNILIEASKTPQFDILDVSGSEVLDIGGAHDSWYNNTWVSSDVLMLLLFNASPLDRGLVEHSYEDGSQAYRFPDDYDKRLHNLVTEHREEFLEKLKFEGTQ